MNQTFAPVNAEEVAERRALWEKESAVYFCPSGEDDGSYLLEHRVPVRRSKL